jgi:hypothetical protein
MFKYTCEWAIVPFSQILIIKSPIITSTCLKFDNLSQLNESFGKEEYIKVYLEKVHTNYEPKH